MKHVEFEIAELHLPNRKEVWRFWFVDSVGALVLNGYHVETRETARHKFKVTEPFYDRLSHESFTMKESDVPLTEAIRFRAMREFMKMVAVKTWSELKKEGKI